jgi:hypothetical protein
MPGHDTNTQPIAFEIQYRGNLHVEESLAHEMGQLIRNLGFAVNLTPLPSEEHSLSDRTPNVLRGGRALLTGQSAIIRALGDPQLLADLLRSQPPQNH